MKTMTMTSSPISFGRRLKRLRQEREWSQLELAANALVSTRHLSFLETGRAKPSEEMVARLAAAMMLDPHCVDNLRVAAGFCSRAGDGAFSIGDHVFESSLVMEGAGTAEQIIDAGRAILPKLGVAQFFFGTLSGEENAKPGFDWANFGAFPVAWLQRYDRERYAMTDPLLTVARTNSDSFFWSDVIDRRSLTRPAREMFDRVEAVGISSGFVVSRRCNGLIHIVSMMGGRIDHQSRTTRLGLEILGSRMLVGLDRLGALPGNSTGDRLPLR